MRLVVAVLVTASLLAAPVATAEPCRASDGESAILSLEEGDQDFVDGLRIGILMGLTPQAFPSEQIAENTEACVRGTFEANSQTYHAFGDVIDSPPRWAIGEDPQRIAYLAVMPPPHVVRRWIRENNARGPLRFTGSPHFVLAITNGETRDIYVIFEQMPGDAQLGAAFRDALEGRLPRVATFNATTGELIFEERQTL